MKSLRKLTVVQKKNGLRSGKGFSLNELKEASLSPHLAKAYKIPFDNKRRSFYKTNIDTLNSIVKERLETKEKEKATAKATAKATETITETIKEKQE